MSERTRAVCAGILVSAFVLTACSAPRAEPVPTPTVDVSTYDPEQDGNGVALLPAADARDAVLAAMRAAGGVEVSGAYRDAASGRELVVQRTGTDAQWTADITIDGAVTRIVAQNDRAEVRAAGPVAAILGIPADTETCVTTRDAAVQRWAPLVSPTELVSELTADASGLAAPADGTVDVLLGADGAAGVLTVATSGAPLPVRLVRADAQGEIDVTFRGWGAAADAATGAAC